MNFLLTLAFIGSIIFILRHYFKRRPALQIDYSFGNPKFISIQKAITASRFTEAESLIRAENVTMRTLAIDHLALTCTSEEIQAWVSEEGGIGFDGLTLAAHYGFSNWSFELNHSFAQASKTAQRAFTLNRENATQHLDLIENYRLYFFEKQLRLIRLKTVNGEIDAAWNHFIAASNQEPDAFFPYLYVAESIQPKWGGDLNRVQRLLSLLPEIPEVRMSVMLKLIHDSFIHNENLFGGSMEELITFATEQLKHIDQELEKSAPENEIKFFLYNYMVVNSERLGNKVMKNKYVLASKGYTTLFPYGPVFKEEVSKM